MTPFITEELFSHLKKSLPDLNYIPSADPYTQETVRALQSPACAAVPYPRVIREKDLNPEIEETFDSVEEIIYTIRNLRGEMKLPPAAAIDAYIIGSGHKFDLVQSNQQMIAALVRTKSIQFSETEPDLPFASTGVAGSLKVMIPLPKELIEQEKKRLQKEEEKLIGQIERLQMQLANPNFTEKAPRELVDKQRAQLSQNESELVSIKQMLKQMLSK